MTKKYIKDGIIYNNINKLKANSKIYINPTESIILSAGYSIYEETELSKEELLNSAKEEKCDFVTRYGLSEELNSCVVNNLSVYIPSDSRIRLRNLINAEIAVGNTEMSQWFNGVCFTYSLEEWDQMLNEYISYLHNVQNTIEMHKANINALTTIEEVQNYDYKVGYPEKLSF